MPYRARRCNPRISVRSSRRLREALPYQPAIKQSDRRRDEPASHPDPAGIGEDTHHRTIAGEHHQGHDRKAELEAEHDLAQHEQLTGAAFAVQRVRRETGKE